MSVRNAAGSASVAAIAPQKFRNARRLTPRSSKLLREGLTGKLL